jgi:YD repeat-containing protein
VKSDTYTYTYDAMGNMLTANNNYARVTRTYTLDGLIAEEEQAIMNYPTGVFTNLVYRLGYDYNRDGQRVALVHPDSLAPGTGRTRFSYDAIGQLDEIVGPLGDVYKFAYDSAGRLTERTFPGPGTVSWGYDVDGRVKTHSILLDTLLLTNDTILRDGVGRVHSVDGNSSSDLDYNGLGQLTRAFSLGWLGPLTDERFVSNGLGQQLYRATVPELADSTGFENTYDSISGRLKWADEVWVNPDVEPSGWGDHHGASSHTYDLNGNRYYSTQERTVWDINELDTQQSDLLLTFRDETGSIYSADDRLMFHQINRDSVDHEWPFADSIKGNWGAFEEYWYDALGRRVMKRSVQEDSVCVVQNRCHSSIERTIWDGEQIAWEVRQDGSGNDATPSAGDQRGGIGYIHGLELDAPMALIRKGL